MSEFYQWKLDKYAVFEEKHAQQTRNDPWKLSENNFTENWIVTESLDKDMVMLFRADEDLQRLVIIHGTAILETISLLDANKWMKALSKDDSMFFLAKHGNQSRRFKVRFLPAEKCNSTEQCNNCTSVLMKYFPIKICSNPTQCSSDTASQTPDAGDKSAFIGCNERGEATLGEITTSLLQKENKLDIPDVYNQIQSLPFASAQLNQLIALSLTDPTFPAFVNQVDNLLNSLMDQNLECL